jgi:hypothetical protein
VGINRHGRGGHELSSQVQDRPEQNAGYDEALRRGIADDPRLVATI